MDPKDVGVKVRVKLFDGQFIEGWLYGETHDGLFLALDEKAEQIRFISLWESIEKDHSNQADFISYLRGPYPSPNVSKSLEKNMNAALDRIDYNRMRRIQNEFITLLNKFYDPRLDNLPGRVDYELDHQIIYEFKATEQAGNQSTLVETAFRLKTVCTSLVDELNKSGVKAVLIQNAEEIRILISNNGLPRIDFELFSRRETRLNLRTVEILVRRVNLISETDAGQQLLDKLDVANLIEITKEENLEESVPREKSKWPKRLKITSALGKMALGGSLAAANISIGSIAGVIAAIPTLGIGTVGATVGIITSTYGGLNSACDGLRDLANVIESK